MANNVIDPRVALGHCYDRKKVLNITTDSATLRLCETAVALCRREPNIFTNYAHSDSAIPTLGVTNLDRGTSESAVPERTDAHPGQPGQRLRTLFPVLQYEKQILETLKDSRVAIITGGTGSGKTTQIPQMLLKASRSLGRPYRIICTQPRRVCAESIAERVAYELGELLGHSVGFAVQGKSIHPWSDRSCIFFMTMGVLINMLTQDPQLKDYAVVILDEFHERTVEHDVLLSVLRKLAMNRSDFQLIVMSATMPVQTVQSYLNNCPVVNLPGLTHGVDEYYLEDIEKLIGVDEEASATLNLLYDEEESDSAPTESLISMGYVCRLMLYVLENDWNFSEEIGGTILVFLPKVKLIKALKKQMQLERKFMEPHVEVVEVYGALPVNEQASRLTPAGEGQTKIIICTNLLETSVTVSDAKIVIDYGRQQQAYFQPQQRLTQLQDEWISDASWQQRKGRVGRTDDGSCYYLYSSAQGKTFSPKQKPEILTSDLSTVCLRALTMGAVSVDDFFEEMLDHPNADDINEAMQTLTVLGAVTEAGNLTGFGRRLAALPVDLHAGKLLLLGCIFDCFQSASVLAAFECLQTPLFFGVNVTAEGLFKRMKQFSPDGCSDHFVKVTVLLTYLQQEPDGPRKEWCSQNFINEDALIFVLKKQKQLERILHDIGYTTDSFNPGKLQFEMDHCRGVIVCVLAASFYNNVGFYEPGNTENEAMTPSRGPIKISSESVGRLPLAKSFDFFVATDIIRFTHSLIAYQVTWFGALPVVLFGDAVTMARDEDRMRVDIGFSHVLIAAQSDTREIIQVIRPRLMALLRKRLDGQELNAVEDMAAEKLLTAVKSMLIWEYNDPVPGCHGGYQRGTRKASKRIMK